MTLLFHKVEVIPLKESQGRENKLFSQTTNSRNLMWRVDKKKSKPRTHLIIIIQDMLFDLRRIHPGNKILHISKETTGKGTLIVNDP